MTNIQLELTPAMQAYLVGLIYRNTRTSCLSLAAVCAHLSHDRLQRMLYQRFAWSRRLWDSFAAGMVREGGWGGASAQKARAQVAHLHLGLYALCITEQAALKKGQTIYAFKRRLFRLLIPEHLPQLEDLSLAA
jgi:hypothetical protein